LTHNRRLQFNFQQQHTTPALHTVNKIAACSVGWWLMAGAGLF
jgi:hypothetical protein